MVGMSEDAFLEAILARIPPTPPNHAQIVALNEAGELPDGRSHGSRGGSQPLCRLLAPPRRRSGSGLRENWQQFSLLVLINAFVGGMVGLERTVVPLLAEQEFGLASRTIALSFIVSFGVVKALANLFAGRFSDRIGRKQILVAGWLFGLPVPIIIMLAPSWDWIVLANVLLGINQGLCWSTTVIMKIDLVGPARRGLAMGLNEAAGYLAVAGGDARLGLSSPRATGCDQSRSTWASSLPWPDSCSRVVFVRDSHAHARHEGRLQGGAVADAALSFREIFALTSWKDRRLFAVSQAGLVNNLNDGMAWGLFPLFFTAGGLADQPDRHPLRALSGRVGVWGSLAPARSPTRSAASR